MCTTLAVNDIQVLLDLDATIDKAKHARYLTLKRLLPKGTALAVPGLDIDPEGKDYYPKYQVKLTVHSHNLKGDITVCDEFGSCYTLSYLRVLQHVTIR